MTYFSMYPEVLTLPGLASITLWPLDFSWADLITDPAQTHALLDKKLGIAAVIRAMTVPRSRSIIDRLLGRQAGSQGLILLTELTDLLQEIADSAPAGVVWTPPFVLYALARFIQEKGRRINLGSSWRIELGGGWKLLHEKPLSEAELKKLASSALGLPAEQIYDIYGSTECLGLCGLSCEAGYKHVPHAVLHPMVLDEQMQPLPDGQWGRFAYLNPLGRAYPGFIVTGDRVRMWRRCPACTRTGLVLDSQVGRMAGAEDRGCANIVQDLINERLTILS